MTKNLTVVRTTEDTYVGVYLNGKCIIQGHLTDDDRDEDDPNIEDFIKGATYLADNVTNVTVDETSTLPDTWPKLFASCKYGTSFEFEGCSIEVEINNQSTIMDVTVPGVWSQWIPVVMLNTFAQDLKAEVAGERSTIWTDHDEEPSTYVYLATGPNWEGARFITTTADLEATVKDPSVYSLVRLSLELDLL